MKFIGIILLLAVLMVFANGQNSCMEHGGKCSESTECCTSYCRAGRCIKWGEVPDDKATDPCATVFCPGGPCIIKEVQCIRAPCPGIPHCIQTKR